MNETKLSSSQTTLTQFQHGEYVIIKSAIKHNIVSSERLIQSPGDVRRALRDDTEKRFIQEEGDHGERVVADDNTRQYFEEDNFYADFELKQRRRPAKAKERKKSTTPNVHSHAIVPPTPISPPPKSTLSNKDIITKYNAILKENIHLKKQYTAACKLARCLSRQLDTIHFATQKPTSRKIDNTEFIDIDKIKREW